MKIKYFLILLFFFTIGVSKAQVDISAGMGVGFVYALSLNNYIEYWEQSDVQPFSSAAEFYCEIDYSILEPKHELDLIPYCEKNNIAIIVRGALHKGLLSGKYNKDSVFEGIRYGWNKGQKWRPTIEEHLDKVDKLKEHFAQGEELISTSLRYLFTNNDNLITLFGAKDSAQVAMNVKAGERLLTDKENEIIKKIKEV